MLRHSLLAALIVLAALLAACGGSDETPAPTAAVEAGVTLAPSEPTATVQLSQAVLYLAFRPDVQFAPFYVGIEMGFFASHGYDLTISHQAESEALRLVGTDTSGSLMKGAIVSGEQVLLARAQELPVIYVYEWYERFPVALASKAERGIAAPADLRGHTVGTPMLEGASYIGLQALLAAGGLTESDISLQVTGFTQVETLLADVVDAVVVYSANEPIQLEAAGAQVNVIQVSDYAQLVSNGLVINEALAQNNPDVVREFVAALSEAVQYTIDHPDEAFDISQGYVEGLGNPDIAPTQREVLARSIELWRAARLGESSLDGWQNMHSVLRSSGLLDRDVTVEQAFSNDFLP